MKIVLLAYTLLLSIAVSFAQDGSLDLSFSTDGRVVVSIGTFDGQASAIAVQSDGKILVAGHSHNNSNYDFALVRFNSDGTLDNSFGSAGVVTTAIGTGDDKARAIALQSDGKIVVAGYSYTGSIDAIAVARYNSNGSLDNTFDGNGMLTTSQGVYNEYAQGVAIQGDGKIVVTGVCIM